MKLNIIVVGTGVGGLGAAIALTNRGHKVTVLEASSKLQAIGGIIVTMPNANLMLDRLGVYKAFRTICDETPPRYSFRTYKGEELCAGTEEFESKYGYPIWNVHRADYQRILYEAAVQKGVKVRLGCPVVSVDDSAPSVTIKGGEVVSGDLILASDGVRSIVRNAINAPDERNAIDTKVDITRLNVPWEVARSEPVTNFLTRESALWFGPDTGFVHIPMIHLGEHIVGIDFLHPRCASSDSARARPMDTTELRGFYRGWAPLVQKMLDVADDVHVWQMYETKPTHWVSSSGRIVLLGDACHALLPNAGQGGGMALEDAMTIAECLERAEVLEDVPRLMRAYQVIREPRCRIMQQRGLIMNQVMRMPNGPAQEARDEVMRKQSDMFLDVPWDGEHIDQLPDSVNAPGFVNWQNGHDANLFANRKLDEMFGTKVPEDTKGPQTSMNGSHDETGVGVAVKA